MSTRFWKKLDPKKVLKPLVVPTMELGAPAPGRRVREVSPEFEGTDVHHSLYLPINWEKGGNYPVIVEYTGNYFPKSGSTGEVKDANLGYGLTTGRDFIWVVLPFVGNDHLHNEVTWWGDEQATVNYCLTTLSHICEIYGGDKNRVAICGFSRGAIAVNYIGLYNDQIASLWRGFISYDHYDGVCQWPKTTWGTPLEVYREKAKERLQRLRERPILIMQNSDFENPVKQYLTDTHIPMHLTYFTVPIKTLFPSIPNEFIPNPHTDKWLLFDNEYTAQARRWLTLVCN